jgi:hypothetical protein
MSANTLRALGPVVALPLLLAATSASGLTHAHGVYATFRNYTANEVTVRVQWARGYAVFGVAPGGVRVERIQPGTNAVVTMYDRSTVSRANLIPVRGAGAYFDAAHDTYYYKITEHEITLLHPKAAKGWWQAGLPK